MNKAIILLNDTSLVGGAQKRYLSLFQIIQDESIYLIVNQELFDSAYQNKLILPSDRIFAIPIVAKKKNEQPTIIMDNKVINSNSNKKRFKRIRKIKWWLGKLFLWYRFITKAYSILKKNNVSIVYSVWLGGIWIWPLKYILKFKLIHSYNDSSVSSVSKKIFDIFGSEYWVLKACDKIDFLSGSYLGLLESKIGKIKSSKISITPNSFIIYDNFYPEYPKENTVVFMSRLIPYKNPMLFLDAVYEFNKTNKADDVKFLIIGEGPLENEIKERISEKKLTNVCFIGKVDKSWGYLRKSKVFVSIQQDENYPSQALLEAMACENAIIASDVGETRRLVTENEGVLVRLNAKEISNAFYLLLTKKNNLGIDARKKVLAEQNSEKYFKYFKSILK